MTKRYLRNSIARQLIFSALALGSVARAETPANLRGLKPLPIADLLRILSSSANTEHPPTATIVLKNGKDFSGVASLYDPSKGTCAVSKNGSLTVINLNDISAVTVLDAGDAATELQGGKIYRPASDTAPSRLELERRLAAVGTKNGIKTTLKLTPETEQNPDCRFAAGKVIAALETTLDGVTKDDMGKQALLKHQGGIVLQHEPGKLYSVESSTGEALTVKFDCLQPLDSTYATDLAHALNGAL